MEIKLHYSITLVALFFLGLILKPFGSGHMEQKQERACHMIKGRIDCHYKYTDYNINKNSDVKYSSN